MENNSNTTTNLFELESLRSELIEKTLNTSSNNLRLFLYQNYFEKILSLDNPNYEEAFLKEFLDDYVHCLKNFDVWGNDPNVIRRLFEQLNNIVTRIFAAEHHSELISENKRIELQWIKLTAVLNGDDYEDGESHKTFFPLIDKEAPEEFYGTLESVTIRINKAVDVDKFIIVPSEKEIEKRILEQCERSWLLAIKLAVKYVKRPFKYHEVIISFDKKEGFYEGNSLGIALTLSFLEEILKFYNPAYLIRLVERSAFTGGVDESGKILNTGEEIIKRKVSSIFFSKINYFIIPKMEETYANFTLAQLKKKFPYRKLKLITAEDIGDVLNRRDVVDIKKQKIIVRSRKFIKKNWISAVATVLLAIVFAFLFVMDFDDNPASLSMGHNLLYVKNGKGKVLWTKSIGINNYILNNPLLLGHYCRIYDVNSDGENEVLISNEIERGQANGMSSNRLLCYDKNKKKIWAYRFTDEVEAKREVIEPYYSIIIIDTVTINNTKNLLLCAGNSASFSSAIIRLDPKTGNRFPGTLWTSGQTVDALIKDVNNDGKKDVFAIGMDNGYEEQVIFAYTIDSLTRVRPSTDDYTIKNYSFGDFITYIRLPNTDYTNHIRLRMPTIDPGNLIDEKIEKCYRFVSVASKFSEGGSIWVKLDYNLKDFDLVISNQFRVLRDSLVAQGKLNLPYTDTEAYKNIIKSNILYWKSGKWVKRNELD